jgi:hypothetical protein
MTYRPGRTALLPVILAAGFLGDQSLHRGRGRSHSSSGGTELTAAADLQAHMPA